MATPSPDGPQWTVLLVDDDPQVRRITGRILRGVGLRVLEAEDGLAALELLRDGGRDVHVVVTDLVMPRMSGRELAFALAHLRPELRIVFITGHPTEDDTHALMAAQETVVLKPFAVGELVATVLAALSEVHDVA
jgi:two-component system, cell cycle sensor histidine kinase and response regulator CckA